MTIPFLNLQASYREIQEDLEAEVLRSLRSGRYIGGPDVEGFERAFAAFVEAEHCVGVANGLDALRLALRALDIGVGDEVIVPSNTFIATWLAVSDVGATPVPVEPRADTRNIDPDLIAAAITPRTRAIIPVHLYGQPADLDPILALARTQGLSVIEDAAQAQGARYKGRRIGAHGDIVTWSFYPGKNLGAAGDAGAITTNRADLADRVALLRNYGSRERYVNEVQGCNSRLDPLQAAILSVKLRHLDRWNARRQAIAALYGDLLAGTALQLPHVPNWADPVWHLYCITHPARDRLRALLQAAGVETLVHYPVPPHRQAAYADMNAMHFPIAEWMAEQLISIPIDPTMSDDDVRFVAAAIRGALAEVER